MSIDVRINGWGDFVLLVLGIIIGICIYSFVAGFVGVMYDDWRRRRRRGS